jgi:dihydroflavonol-4-reductase
MPKRVLVSGATGFIASHVVERLLAAGHEVVGTVRNPKDAPKVAHLLAMTGAEHLHLVAADLTDADPFTAHADVDAVMHMASPYSVDVNDPQTDLVDPAVEGTLSMLRAAAAHPRVKRVVLTSSFAAVTDEPPDRVLTEADWNTQSSLARNSYYYSKTLAERAAWDFVTREKPGFDLVVVNPFVVIGPSHSGAKNVSTQIFIDLVNGAYPAIMALTWGFVDVRDVADAHMAAMNHPAAKGRYLCAAGNKSMAETVAQMRAEGFSGKLPKIDLSGPVGTVVAKLASYTQPQGVGSYMRSHLGRVPRYDTTKIETDLGIAFRKTETSISDTLANLEHWGQIGRNS